MRPPSWVRARGTDVLQALRLCSRQPRFVAAITLTLAIGVGVNGAVFSILHAVLLQPLPYDHPNDVVMVWNAFNRPTNWRTSTDIGHVQAWHDLTHDALLDVAAIKLPGKSGLPMDLVLPDRAERLRAATVTPNFFDILGVRAARGRLFTVADDTANIGDVLVLSDALWRRDFGSDPGIVGRTVTFMTGRTMAPRAFTVMGVLPAAVRFTYPSAPEVWVMQTWSGVNQEPRGTITYDGAVARLRPGMTVAQAQALVDLLNPRINPPRANSPAQFQQSTRLEPIYDWVVGDTRPSLLLLGGVGLLVLLITCATVANALFVRITGRQRELSVRAALGAARDHLLWQLLSEGVLLACLGAAAGTALAALVQPALRAIVPPLVPRADEIGVNAAMLGFGAAAVLLTIASATIVPAWRGARVDLADALKRASATVSSDRSAARWRLGFIVVQSALAAALLTSAALLLASFWKLGHVPLGFDGDRVLTVEMRLFDPKDRQPAALAAFQQDLESRVRAVPGVLEVGLTTAVPFRGTDFMLRLNKTGETDKEAFNANGRAVDAAYFDIMRIPLVRGRLIQASDTANSLPVVVISQSLARQLYGENDPIGQRLDLDSPTEIVGVVGDVRYVSLDKDPINALYRPAPQWSVGLVCLVIRSASNAASLPAAVRGAIRDVAPALPAMNMTTIDQIVSDSVADRRFYTTATAAFALLALLLTMGGLSIVVARAALERRRELAIRGALGAAPRGLLALVMREGMLAVGAGTLFGLAGAFAAAKALVPFLFRVAPREPWVYSAVALIVVSVAAIASSWPAWRATRTSLSEVLRSE